MPITEIALLRLRAEGPSPTTKKNLIQAQYAQTKYSKHLAHFFRQVEDPQRVYITGGWESVAVHTGDWITSETNLTNLGRLKDDVDVEWMFHLDIDVSVEGKVQYLVWAWLIMFSLLPLLSRWMHPSLL